MESKIQSSNAEYNKTHNITPSTIRKAIRNSFKIELQARKIAQEVITRIGNLYEREELITILEKEMLTAAEELEFEKAARIRDQIQEIKDAPEISKKN